MNSYDGQFTSTLRLEKKQPEKENNNAKRQLKKKESRQPSDMSGMILGCIYIMLGFEIKGNGHEKEIGKCSKYAQEHECVLVRDVTQGETLRL